MSRIVALLKARFGSENQTERFRAELRSRKRNKSESLQKLYQDFCRFVTMLLLGVPILPKDDKPTLKSGGRVPKFKLL